MSPLFHDEDFWPVCPEPTFPMLLPPHRRLDGICRIYLGRRSLPEEQNSADLEPILIIQHQLVPRQVTLPHKYFVRF